MRGPKLNEGATAIGERHGTKATAKHVRTSAYKARAVLDLIRGLDVKHADEVLQFTERAVAHDVRKVLASAVANAGDLDSGAYIADPDELFVLACFADEGPTMRRFRPRARGRATRIRKRTCHITIVVARMSEDRIEILQARAEGAGSASANRKARVERSRKQAEETHDEADQSTDVDEATGADEEAEIESFADVDSAEADTDTSEAADSEADDSDASDATDSEEGSDADGGFAAGEWAGSVLPNDAGEGPDSHPIKGNADSMLYHTPDSRYYKVTKAEVWFDTEENAEAAGFAKPGTNKDED